MNIKKNSNKKEISKIIINNKIKNNIILNLKYKNIFNIILFIFMSFLPNYLLKEIKLRKILFTSQIDITIKGDGDQNILSGFNG